MSSTTSAEAVEAESRTGLAPWTRAELPAPPVPKGLGWIGVVGPGVIVLGLSLGSGEFLLGPAAFVRHGLSLLWVTLVAVFFQTIFNTELMRYTVATGEPVLTGFMRTRPGPRAWAVFYSLLFFLQIGWPAWAATAAGAMFFLALGRLAEPQDATTIYYIGTGTFLLCVSVLLIGKRIVRTLEVLNWVLVTVILGSFAIMSVALVPASTWLAAGVGFVGFDAVNARFDLLPQGADFFLLGALVAYSGCGGMLNIALSNWARDKGYGMSGRAGYIPGAVGGHKVELAHSGFTFSPDAESLGRWRGWWRIVRADQWGVFFAGSLLGMVLPALLYVTFVPRGTDIVGLGISAVLASSIGAQHGPMLAVLIGFIGAWLLFKTQLDIVEGTTRAVTDILWTGSRRARNWRGGDVRVLYYTVLAIFVAWGIIALRIAQPVVLLQISANVAGAVFVVAALHLLYINTKLLPRELRPPLWRRVMLVLMSIFYAFFAVLAFTSLGQG